MYKNEVEVVTSAHVINKNNDEDPGTDVLRYNIHIERRYATLSIVDVKNVRLKSVLSIVLHSLND